MFEESNSRLPKVASVATLTIHWYNNFIRVIWAVTYGFSTTDIATYLKHYSWAHLIIKKSKVSHAEWL